MCDVLQLPRSTYYYEAKIRPTEDPLTKEVTRIFQESRQTYGTRRIKQELKKSGHVVSRRRIGKIMNTQGLVSVYTVAQFKPHPSKPNETDHKNELNRHFAQDEELAVVVNDLTYVRVDKKWHYICLFIDLFNRELIGYSTGKNKDAHLVCRALASIKHDLNRIQMFHTDRGSEFKNQLIEEALETFSIQRSLSVKGCPYDNAVAEATFKAIKTEFVKGKHYESLEELNQELSDYVHWFNHHRIHSTLGYQRPVAYKSRHLKNIV